MLAHLFEALGILAAVVIVIAVVVALFLRSLKPGDVP